MRELFDYFEESEIKRIKTTLGMSISRIVGKTFKDKGRLPQYFNEIDRMKFAEGFIDNKLGTKFKFDIFSKWYKTTREFERYEFENDIAQYMDLKIPQDYYIGLLKLSGETEYNSRLKLRYKGIDSLDGIMFLYEENYHLEEELLKAKMERPITKKQLSYLKRLIKYSHQRLRVEDIDRCSSLKDKIEKIGIENLTLEEAKNHITTFLDFEKAYKEQYEEEAKSIDNSVKIIDFSKYR